MGKKKDLQLLNSKLHKKMAGKSNTDIKLEKEDLYDLICRTGKRL